MVVSREWNDDTGSTRVDPYLPFMKANPPVPSSHLGRLIRNPPDRDSCWPWPGSRNAAGYGRTKIYMDPAVYFAHRITYMWFVGPIPDGLTIDHLCRNPPCVNPWHLEPVTMAENTRRARVSGSVRRPFGSIRQLPSGMYQARYRIPGTHKWVNGPHTYTDRAHAEAWLAVQADAR